MWKPVGHVFQVMKLKECSCTYGNHPNSGTSSHLTGIVSLVIRRDTPTSSFTVCREVIVIRTHSGIMALAMLLTITNTKSPATDLGCLLHKNPRRVRSFELSFGKPPRVLS